MMQMSGRHYKKSPQIICIFNYFSYFCKQKAVESRSNDYQRTFTMSVRTILLALTMLLSVGQASAAVDYKNDAEYLTLRDSMRHAFNDGDSARFFPALKNLEDYLFAKDDMHGYYTQRCNEIVFLMNRQRIYEAYKLARQLSLELRQKKLDKEMFMAYNMLGHINRYCGNKEAAKRNFYTVIEMMEKAGYYENIPPIYMNIVNVALDDDHDEAMRLLEKAKEIAEKYAPERVFDIETRRTLSYFNSGDIPRFLEGYEEYRKGVAEGKSSVHGRTMEIYHLATIGKVDEAVKMAKEELGEDGNDAITVIYERAGRWQEAYKALKKETLANDSINNVVLTNSMEGIRDELRLYDAEREMAHNRTMALSTVIVLLALLVGALTYIVMTRRRHLRELKRAYDHALEADKMKSAFIRNVTHEVRTPLNIISGFGQVLSDPDLDAGPQERKEMAKMMLKNTSLITSLIDEMLQLSFNETTTSPVAKEDNVDVNDLLRDLLQENESKVAPGVTMNIESQLPNGFTFLTNEELFKRILNPLIDNACKYTDKGTITLKAAADDDLLTLAVEDTGTGIPDNEAERVFERFVKLDTFKEGLGLGLPLSRMIANRIGGNVTLDTSYKQGARFVVELRN